MTTNGWLLSTPIFSLVFFLPSISLPSIPHLPDDRSCYVYPTSVIVPLRDPAVPSRLRLQYGPDSHLALNSVKTQDPSCPESPSPLILCVPPFKCFNLQVR
ncbi:hypothetical protein DFH09DRAFT_1196289 [Mycena vulgaris]|nr:hypothetical protein DFH09DRAFT_1231543 [Mycena vulgaris]KAJ6514664.1 hypothetical protein DFH09DRAFT_1196289 [Mycena vulgaris]